MIAVFRWHPAARSVMTAVIPIRSALPSAMTAVIPRHRAYGVGVSRTKDRPSAPMAEAPVPDTTLAGGCEAKPLCRAAKT